jgi:OmpA-OmpF porin, OOP family
VSPKGWASYCFGVYVAIQTDTQRMAQSLSQFRRYKTLNTLSIHQERIMKKMHILTIIFAVGLSMSSARSFAQAGAVDNWVNPNGLVWMNGSNQLCWRDASWTAATAVATCDGALQPVAPAVVPTPVAAPAPEPVAPVVAAPAPVPMAPVAPVSEKVTFSADAFFDFDKATLKPEGKASLDDLVNKMTGVNLEVIIAVGHTDSVGGDAHNQKLSLHRAEAVKAYLLGKGIEKSRVYTEGKGEKQPVADNKTKEGRQKNRRVEIEVVGTRTK